ncbi:MAG: pseudouridine-5'-phosphate glycosidase [Phycisphaerales bacterium]
MTPRTRRARPARAAGAPRSPLARVALETTLLVHGVPRAHAPALARDLALAVHKAGGLPMLIGVVAGQVRVGMNDADLKTMLSARDVPKLNTASIGAAIHQRSHGATTVSTTMELAAGAGIRLFATGGLGGVHREFAKRLDISADLAAFVRFPVAVVTSGCKSILDVASTREALETLGVPVIGYRTDRFPAFYQREGDAGVDARFDDPADLAAFIHSELSRTGRGMVICNPIPKQDEINRRDWDRWLAAAGTRFAVRTAEGRDATPALLAALHQVSKGRTLKANIALALNNADLAGRLASHLASPR